MIHIRKNSRRRCCTALVSFAGLLMGLSSSVAQADTVCPANTNFNNCGIPAALWPTEAITISTTSGSNVPQYAGIYIKWNAFHLNDLTITTGGSDSDGVRGDDTASWLFANNLTVTTTGTSADGINIASNSQGGIMPSGVVISNSANITTKGGMGVRVNDFLRQGDLSIAILPSGSTVSVIGTGTATQGTSALSADAYGYGVYAGNRTYDMNNIGVSGALAGTNNNTLGDAYAFVGGNSTISDSMRNGHAVYANKGGFIQLGDGVNVSATGAGGYALYAATEKQGSYATNVRPGYIYLEGGATLQVTNGVAGSDGASSTVMQVSGADSIIVNRALDISGITYPVSGAFTSMSGLPDKTTDWAATSGVFDVTGIMSAINGGAIDLDMADGSSFLGSTAMSSSGSNPASTIDLNIAGATSQWVINANSTLSTLKLSSGATLEPFWTTANDPTAYQLQGLVNSNGGILYLVNGVAGSDTFTIIGNYAASGDAQLHLDTVLDDDASPTDKLVIDGSTSGTTTVHVNAVSGAGAQTGDGILVVEVTGASDGEFVLDNGPLVAGDYEYTLSRGTSNPNNWYLISLPKGKQPPNLGLPPPASPVPTLEPKALLMLLLLVGGAMMVTMRRNKARR